MKTKTIALTTSALVAVAALATAATAGGMYAGKMNLGMGYSWEGYDNAFTSWDNNFSTLQGSAQVNVPYSDTVNLQLDILGAASMDNYTNLSGAQDSFYGGFAGSAHLNYRDNQGALGVFALVGRANVSSEWATDFVAFAGGVEGQYFLNAWTLKAQAGFLDADEESWGLQNAGFISAGANYYPSSKLKLSGQVGYVNGETDDTNNPDDISEWNWSLGIEYVFGKSVPVSTYLEYRGQSIERDYSPSNTPTLDRDSVNVGVRFYFGGDGDLVKADREGAGMEDPDFINWMTYNTSPTQGN